jgi:hypothetical protein
MKFLTGGKAVMFKYFIFLPSIVSDYYGVIVPRFSDKTNYVSMDLLKKIMPNAEKDIFIMPFALVYSCSRIGLQHFDKAELTDICIDPQTCFMYKPKDALSLFRELGQEGLIHGLIIVEENNGYSHKDALEKILGMDNHYVYWTS